MARRPRTDDDATPPPGTPHTAALGLLGRRDYTARELTRRLIDRGYPADAVHEAIARLVADGTIDDGRTAAAYVRTASRVKGRGVSRITRELEARGVAAPLVRQATAQISDDDTKAAIERFLTRKRVPRPVPVDQRRRLFGQLLRRGFPVPLISAALSFAPDEDA